MRSILAAFAAVLSFGTAAVAADYPSKPVTLVIAFAPGGSNDNIGRFLANELGELWGQSVVVENRGGAGTAIGTGHVATSNPDGYTLLLNSSSYATLPALQENLPYDPLTDLRPITMVAYSPQVIAVGPRVKAQTLGDLIEEIKSRDFFYGTAGLGTTMHFGSELLNAVADINMQPVHYQGAAAAIVDIVGERVDAYIGTIGPIQPQIEAGHIRVLGSMTEERILDGVPTTAEVGLERAVAAAWWGVFAPKDTPEDIVQKLNADIIQVMSTPKSTEFLEGQQTIPRFYSTDEFKQVVVDEIAGWKNLAAERGIKAQ